MNKDCIFVDGFEVPCRVGTTKEERAFPQILRISLRIELPLAKAGQSDDLHNTIDYAELIEYVRRALDRNEFNLVEAVAETIAGLVLREPKTRSVDVTVGKKVFVGIQSVGVSIHREKKAR